MREFKQLIAICEAALSSRAKEVLWLMANPEEGDDGLLVKEGLEVWIGSERTSVPILMQLIRAMSVKSIEGEPPGYEVFEITASGRQVAANPAAPRPPA